MAWFYPVDRAGTQPGGARPPPMRRRPATWENLAGHASGAGLGRGLAARAQRRQSVWVLCWLSITCDLAGRAASRGGAAAPGWAAPAGRMQLLSQLLQLGQLAAAAVMGHCCAGARHRRQRIRIVKGQLAHGRARRKRQRAPRRPLLAWRPGALAGITQPQQLVLWRRGVVLQWRQEKKGRAGGPRL